MKYMIPRRGYDQPPPRIASLLILTAFSTSVDFEASAIDLEVIASASREVQGQ